MGVENVSSDLRQAIASTDEKTGDGYGVGSVEYARIFIRSDKMDKIRNEYIRGTAEVGRFGEKTREARLRR